MNSPELLAPGTHAPPFALPYAPGPSSSSSSSRSPFSTDERIGLADYLGKKHVILAFYPADFTPVCSDELAIFNELRSEFERFGAQMLGVSVDSKWCHAAFARERRLRFPLLADFHPKGEVCRAYQAYREDDGFAARALYVIDRDGTIFWSFSSPIDENPGADGVLDALERLRPRTETEVRT